jgi:hypothetical protein
VFFYSIILGVNYVLLTDTFRPHRKALHTNFLFCSTFLLLNLYAHLLILVPEVRISWLEITDNMSISFRIELVCVAWGTLGIIYFFEYFCTNIMLKKLRLNLKKTKVKHDVKKLKSLEEPAKKEVPVAAL